MPSAVCPGRWLCPPIVFLETTEEQQRLLRHEEQWNRALEIPDTLLSTQSKSEVTRAREKHVGTGGCAGLSPGLKHRERVPELSL